jgi:hypothetical protein
MQKQMGGRTRKKARKMGKQMERGGFDLELIRVQRPKNFLKKIIELSPLGPCTFQGLSKLPQIATEIYSQRGITF